MSSHSSLFSVRSSACLIVFNYRVQYSSGGIQIVRRGKRVKWYDSEVKLMGLQNGQEGNVCAAGGLVTDDETSRQGVHNQLNGVTV